MTFHWQADDIHEKRRLYGRDRRGDYVIAAAAGSRSSRYYLFDAAEGLVLGQPLSATAMATRLTEEGFHPEPLLERRVGERRKGERRRVA